MAFQKVVYVDNQTIITAKNMNEMQDAVIEAEKNAADAKKESEEAKTAAEGAQKEVSEAKTAATNAQNAASAAQTAATNAQTAANESKAAATNAQTAASAAQTAATNAQNEATEAKTAAANVQTAASAAQTAATNAQTAANESKAAATNAQTASEESRAAATTAQTAAKGAQEVAQDAKETAERLTVEVNDFYIQIEQQNLLFAEGETVEAALEWLETNGDTTKSYVLPDGFFYNYRETTEEGGIAYTNLLPLAKATDRTSIYNGKGYKENTKLSGSGGGESADTKGLSSSGFIFPVEAGDILRIKGITPVTGSNHYVVGYDSANARTGNDIILFQTSGDSLIFVDAGNGYSGYYTIDDDGTIVYTINTAKLGANVNAVRICAGMDENTIVTVNEEIKEGGGTVIVKKWANTGYAFVASDYDEVLAELKRITDSHTEDITAMKEQIENGTPQTDEEKLEMIKAWDAPIYDANIPVFELSTEKSAITEAEKTVAAVYAKYDALMERHPNYITKTDLGMCSDGVTPVYRYDFREPEPHRGTSGTKEWSETKAKAIIVSGIHWEWGGIFALYNALEEIADNPELFDFRRNTHLIVLPVCNPYAVANMSVRNANQVEIHRNFEVDFIYPGEAGYIEIGERSHGGTEPLSEVETQYIDNIMKENTDAALFLSCHSYQSDSLWGVDFMWHSPATFYMCNMGYRVIDKLSKAWMKNYGDVLEQGIADYKTENLEDWDKRLGHGYLSTTNGTEAKQATKYGIQGVNVEICDTFWVHGTTEKPEATLSAFTMSRGAEVYVNFLLTAFGVYDHKDKADYYKK